MQATQPTDCEKYLESQQAITLIQKNDYKAIDQWYKCLDTLRQKFYRGVVKSYNNNCPEEAFDDAKVDLYKQIRDGNFPPKTDKITSYFFGIFFNKQIDCYKKHLIQIAFDDNPFFINKPSSDNDPEKDLLDQDELLWQKELIFEVLTDAERKIYSLKYEQFLEPAEIATNLNIEVATVYQTTNRMKNRLIQIIQQKNK